MTHILLLPGDGIGCEVIAAARRVLDHLIQRDGLVLTVEEDDLGGAAYDRHGTPLAAETLVRAKRADAVLMGAVGGSKWADVPYDKRPEAGLLSLRRELGLFANLRPAFVFEPLVAASTLKEEVVRGLDIMIVRELTGGVYFGEPRGITTLANGQRQGLNTQVYTTSEIHRVARVAFELARGRRGQVVSCEKSNVMESGLLWRQEVTALHASDYADVTLAHMYADNCAMQLVRNPAQFDVILTDNLFGDILSDEASMLTGSLGMLPSASLGQATLGTTRRSGLYEPVHGSAPDIAGRDIANPLAAILSLAMLFRWSLDMPQQACAIEAAVGRTLDDGLRTADIMSSGVTQIGTTAMAQAVVERL